MADGGTGLVAQNRKAHHNYLIEESLEAGLILTPQQREGRTRHVT